MTLSEIIQSLAETPGPLETPCHLWTRSKSKRGYGTVKFESKTSYVHKVVYEHFVGSVSKGKELDHLCRNPLCANPKHLEPVTHQINVLRGISLQAKNAQKTHCPKGHPYANENLIVNNRGGRECLTCKRDRGLAYVRQTRGEPNRIYPRKTTPTCHVQEKDIEAP